MALRSSVTVLVAHPEPRSHPAIGSKSNFFIARNIDPYTMIALGKEHSNNASRRQASSAPATKFQRLAALRARARRFLASAATSSL